jgi:hypothetical protein
MEEEDCLNSWTGDEIAARLAKRLEESAAT